MSFAGRSSLRTPDPRRASPGPDRHASRDRRGDLFPSVRRCFLCDWCRLARRRRPRHSLRVTRSGCQGLARDLPGGWYAHVDQAGQHDAHDARDASGLVAADRVVGVGPAPLAARGTRHARAGARRAGRAAVAAWPPASREPAGRAGDRGDPADTRVVVIGADGSIEVRAGPEAPAS